MNKRSTLTISIVLCFTLFTLGAPSIAFTAFASDDADAAPAAVPVDEPEQGDDANEQGESQGEHSAEGDISAEEGSGSDWPAEGQPVAVAAAPLRAPAANSLPSGLTITRAADGTAAVEGTDYTISGTNITFLTSDELILSSTSSITAGFNITAGTTVNLIFNGLKVQNSARSVFEIAPQGTLNVILADGSTNSVLGTSTWRQAFHVPPGAKFSIDDALRNETVDGTPIVPLNAEIPYDCTLKYYDGTVDTTVELHAGDNANKLDSPNPGKLTARGSSYAAIIGGTGYEDGGTMTFNGGNVTVYPYDTSNGGYAAGIGGGGYAAGTSPDDWMTFNGGYYDVKGSYHGAGIGGGYNNTAGGAGPNITVRSTHHSAMGNIAINGGYIMARNGGHGNSIGKGCYSSMYRMYAEDYTFRMTGGTVETNTVKSSGATPSYILDLGATDYVKDASGKYICSNIIITGGSLRLSQGMSGFDGAAYSDDSKTTQVFMTRINLVGYDNIPKGTPVQLMSMSVAGVPYDYGQATYVDSTKSLYFWLPNNTTGDEIRVKLYILDQDGNNIPLDDFTVTNTQTDGTTLKQWSKIAIDNSQVSDEDRLVKRYDGLPFNSSQQVTFVADLFGEGLTLDNPTGAELEAADAQTAEVQSQRLDDETLEPVEGLRIEDTTTQSGAGKYQLIISSRKYANATGFKESFWGHRGTYKYAEIIPADVAMTTTAARSEAGGVASTETITLSTIVRPGDNEAETCAAPQGTIEYYAQMDNGTEVKVAEAVLIPAVETLEGQTDPTPKTLSVNGKTFYYSEASVDWTPSTGAKFAMNRDNTYKIITKFIPGYDPDDQSHAVNYNACSIDTPDVVIEPVEQGFVVDIAKGSNTATRILNKDDVEAADASTYGDYGEDGTTPTVKLLPSTKDGDTQYADNGDPFTFASSKPEVASVDDNGNVTIKQAGTTTFTITKPGDGAYQELSKTITYTVHPIEQGFIVDEVADAATARILGRTDTSTTRAFTFGDHGEDGTTSTITLGPSTKDGDTQYADNGTAFTFASSDPDVATIDADGNITVKKAGEVTFTITKPGDGIYTTEQKTVTYQISPKHEDAEHLLAKKTAERSGSGTISAGEIITYRIALTNDMPGTVVSPVWMRDKLPDGLEIASSAITIQHPDRTLENIAVTNCYNESSRYVTVSLGELSYGQSVVVTIPTVVKATGYRDMEGVLHKYDFGNTAEYGPGENDEGKPEYPGSVGPVYPGGSASSTDDPDPLYVEKSAELDDEGNLLYAMKVENRDIVPWYDVVFRDILPEETTIVEDTLAVQAPGQAVQKLDQNKYYDPVTRTIDYPIGVLYPGEIYIISFVCNVETEVLEDLGEEVSDIENVGTIVTPSGDIDTPGVRPGDTGGSSGDPAGVTLSKRASYSDKTPNEMTYTITLQNEAGKDAQNVSVNDELPEPLTLKSGSLRLTLPDGTVQALADDEAYDTATRTISYTLGTVKDSETYVLTFTTLITAKMDAATRAEVEEALAAMGIEGVTKVADIRNSASAGGTWPGGGGGGDGDGGGPWEADTPDVSPGESGGGNSNGDEPPLNDQPDIRLTKTAQDETHADNDVHVGDTIAYTITAANKAKESGASTISRNTIITEYFPEGMDVLFDSMQLIVPGTAGTGQESISPLTRVDTLGTVRGTYSVTAGTITRNDEDVAVQIVRIQAGDIRPGETVYLYVRGVVGEEMTDIGNSVGLGDEPPLDPVYPGENKEPKPEEETLDLEKAAEPRDETIHYAVHLKNPTRRSTWRNVQLFDYLPPQLEIVSGSLKIQHLMNGRVIEEFVPDSSIYNPSTHTLQYHISRLRAGEEYVLMYAAQVKGTAQAQTQARADIAAQKPIENKAEYTGDGPKGPNDGTTTNVVPYPEKSLVPGTGDTTTFWPWLVLGGVALAGVLVAGVGIRRNTRRR